MVSFLKEYREPSLSERFGNSFAQTAQAASQQIPQLLYQKQLQNEENQSISRLTGRDLSGLSPEMKKIYLEKLARSPQHDRIVEALVQRGVSPEDAELYVNLSVGGQTAFAKELLESGKRSGKNLFQNQPAEGEREFQQEELTPEKSSEKEFKDFIQKQDEGLTPSERVARGKERYTTGLKQYQEAGTKLRGMTRDKERLDLLEQLNKSPKLPKNLERLNVDKDGNLRVPFAASPEAQRYVKTLNEFTANAKESFGARITNFDLSQFLKRFPTLVNSSEGRRQLLQQMKVVNQINSVYYKNLKNVYDEAGGVRKIDADAAERFAEQLSEPKIEKLLKKFDDVSAFTSLPSASEFKGKKIVNNATGERLVSDGQNWIPEGE